MLFSPVYIEAHPRQIAAHAAPSITLKSFNPFLLNGFRTLSCQWTPATPFLSAVSGLFPLQWGCTPLTLSSSTASSPISSISRRPSHFSSTAYKMLLAQLLCFDNDPFSWGVYTPSNGISPNKNSLLLRSVPRCLCGKPTLQGAEEFVEFVGGVEVGFEFAGGEALARIAGAGSKEEWRGELAATWSGQPRFRDGATPSGRKRDSSSPACGGLARNTKGWELSPTPDWSLRSPHRSNPRPSHSSSKSGRVGR
jgi:hypothetical protein